jgi:hypothetical protein
LDVAWSKVVPLELSVDEWKAWILDFCEFNALAVEGGGYVVK